MATVDLPTMNCVVVVVGNAVPMGSPVQTIVGRIVRVAIDRVVDDLKPTRAVCEVRSRAKGLGSRGFWFMPKKST